MYHHIVFVIKLAKDYTTSFLGDMLGQLGGTSHALGSWREYNLATEGQEHGSSLETHGIGHHENKLVAFGSSDHGHANASVATSGLNQEVTWLDSATNLSSLDHGLSKTVLYRVAWVLRLKLSNHSGACPVGNLVQSHKRGVSNQLGDGVGNLGSSREGLLPLRELILHIFNY